MTQNQKFTRMTRTKRTMVFSTQYPKIKQVLCHPPIASFKVVINVCWAAREGMLLWAEVGSSKKIFPSLREGGTLHSSCTTDFSGTEVPLQSQPQRTFRGMHSFLQVPLLQGVCTEVGFCFSKQRQENNSQSRNIVRSKDE